MKIYAKGEPPHAPTHFQIEFTNERIIPAGGLTLVGHIIENSGFIERLNRRRIG